MQYYEQKLKL